MNIETALKKLNTLLPLYDRQCSLSQNQREIHQSILRDFAGTGNVQPGYDHEVLNVLGMQDLIVLDKTSGEVTGAYPFSLKSTPHCVTIEDFEVYAMCAFDAIAIAPVFNQTTCIKSRCFLTNEIVELSQSGSKVIHSETSRNLFIGIRWQETGSCAAESLCMEMVFLKDEETAQQWQRAENGTSVFSLTDALEFATRYFKPLTERQ